MACRRCSAASLAGLVLGLTLAAAATAWGSPPGDDSPLRGGPERSLTDGILDTPLEYDRKFKGVHQHGREDGHLPPSSANVELVGKLEVSDAAPGRIADVASFGNFAYLGAFFEPDCRKTGVWVIDISNPGAPREAGFIPATPGFYVGEGVQVVHLDTPAFRGEVLVHNNESCATGVGPGGMSLWDVTDPRRPRPLASHVGDPDVTPPANAIHSAFAWQQGNGAFAVQVDDYEGGFDDVDIFDITDPTRPVRIAEVGLEDWPAARNAFESQPWGMGESHGGFLHDVQVRNVNGEWRMVLSYWDAGYIVLDVSDPAAPSFVADSDFPDPDPFTGVSSAGGATSISPEGNAHYAEWDRSGRFLLAADEDFTPEGLHGKIVTEGSPDRPFHATQGVGPQVDSSNPLVGPTYFIGRACDPLEVPPSPAPETVAVIERGGCSLTLKATNVGLAGYQGGIVFNRPLEEGEDPQNADSTGPCEITFAPLAAGTVPFLFVARSVGFKLLGIEGYDADDCGRSEPALPTGPTAGEDVEVRVVFDGWGYMRLLDADSLEEIDSYAIPEARAPALATGAGWLTVHETAADPTHDVAYLSWYSGGFRVVAFDGGDLRETGHYIDAGGNDFWGVQVHVTPDCRRLVLASDRDYGLYIFRYTGVPSTVPCPAAGTARPGTSAAPAAYASPRSAGRCSNRIRGSNRRDRLRGTPAGDRIDALRGNDVASGLGGADCLDGGPGRDRLLGGVGNDRVVGGRGSDTLSGGPGNDRLRGAGGNDYIRGDAGNDRLHGGRGSNRYVAGSGNDYINSANGRRDRVRCGRGRDRVRADPADRLRGCERVRRMRALRG